MLVYQRVAANYFGQKYKYDQICLGLTALDLSVLRDKIVFVGRRTAKLAMEL